MFKKCSNQTNMFSPLGFEAIFYHVFSKDVFKTIVTTEEYVWMLRTAAIPGDCKWHHHDECGRTSCVS